MSGRTSEADFMDLARRVGFGSEWVPVRCSCDEGNCFGWSLTGHPNL